MSFTSAGVDITLRRNEGTGKFDLDWDSTGPNKGNPKFDDTRAHSVLSTLHSHKEEYYWDESGNRGTLLHTIKQDRLATGSQLVGYAEDGGQQLVNERLIASFSAQATRERVGRWRLDVTWSLPSGTYRDRITL